MSIGSSPTTGHPVFQGQVLALTLGLGALNILLFFLLFHFADQLNALAYATRKGAKLYALVPIVIAMPIAIVHGTFIDYLWDLLGLRAKR